MDIEKAIAKRIHEIIKEKEITLYKLCQLSEITTSTLSEFFMGKTRCPSINTINKICMGAEISLAEFFDREYFKLR